MLLLVSNPAPLYDMYAILLCLAGYVVIYAVHISIELTCRLPRCSPPRADLHLLPMVRLHAVSK
jgi:hypothetical protein